MSSRYKIKQIGRAHWTQRAMIRQQEYGAAYLLSCLFGWCNRDIGSLWGISPRTVCAVIRAWRDA